MTVLISPHRAHVLNAEVQADTVQAVDAELRRLATRVERGELTAGCVGGPDCGTSYAYRHDATVTHDSFFEQVDAYLAARAALVIA